MIGTMNLLNRSGLALAAACALLLTLGMEEATLAASSGKTKQSGGNLTQDERLSLYAEPLAFMTFCDIKIDEAAVSRTLESVGLKGVSRSSLSPRAEKFVEALRAQYGPDRIEFCKSSRTIPVVKQWTAAQ
jgi:hypothetical protein